MQTFFGMQKSFLSFAVAILFGALQAHNIYFEPQARYDDPSTAPFSPDASFANPFTLQDNFRQSQIIYGYLDWGDIDVFKFRVCSKDLLLNKLQLSSQSCCHPLAKKPSSISPCLLYSARTFLDTLLIYLAYRFNYPKTTVSS